MADSRCDSGYSSIPLRPLVSLLLIVFWRLSHPRCGFWSNALISCMLGLSANNLSVPLITRFFCISCGYQLFLHALTEDVFVFLPKEYYPDIAFGNNRPWNTVSAPLQHSVSLASPQCPNPRQPNNLCYLNPLVQALL